MIRKQKIINIINFWLKDKINVFNIDNNDNYIIALAHLMIEEKGEYIFSTKTTALKYLEYQKVKKKTF